MHTRSTSFISYKLTCALATFLVIVGGGLTALRFERQCIASNPAPSKPANVQRENKGEKNYSQIEDGLYLGGHVDEPPPGTKAVLNVCRDKDCFTVENYCWHGIPDAAPAPSLDWLREQVQFIDKERRAGHVVFVHCWAGMSRSALVTTAYLMVEHHWSRDEALKFVRGKRPIVSPNTAFVELLHRWEQTTKS